MADRGTFFLGTSAAPADSADPRLEVGSSDLTTHGVIVGMTGSGKTGLGIVLLEEALLAGIPVLAIDPKGDMGNLALSFPDLAPASFRPWVSEAEAAAAGISADDLASKTATTWKDGLARHGIDGTRIAELKAAADVTIYTPGSNAGVPLNVIGSLRAPPLSWDTEAEALRDEIESTVTSLLGLVGIVADPLSSREHVLLANLVENAWRAGRDLDLGALVGEVQAPPIRKLGVFEIDAFFPPKERTELALKLNGLIASPSFAAWGEGAPLDPQSLLFTPDGEPRAAIVYLAHLSDDARQFAVTLVLSKLVTWMRGQQGTADLRVLAYMDEVYGYVPPTAAPPAKKPILTLLKQGRAFGLGLVLSTQNPVDLDYKAMANAGTWLVGRLQTENDKARVLEALRSAAGGTDVAALDAAIGGLQKRQFMLVSAKDSTPRVFGTRWAMSYLRGPLTKEEVRALMAGRAAEAATAAATTTPDSAAEAHAKTSDALAATAPGADETSVAPPTATEIPIGYLDASAPWAASIGADTGSRRLHAFLAARVRLRYDDTSAGIDEQQELEAVYGPLDAGLDLTSETLVDFDERDFRPDPPAGATYVITEAPIAKSAFFKDAARQIQQRLVDTRPLEISRNRKLKLASRPGESADDFARRCDEAAQAAADTEAAKIRDRLEAKRDRLEQAQLLAQRRVEELDTQTRSRQANELVTGAGAVLGALLGGRRNARSIASAVGRAASQRGQTATTAERRETAQLKVKATADDLVALEQEILDEITEIDGKWRAIAADVESVAIRLEATDVRVTETRLVWVPAP
jgi:hypothetical protein